MEITARENMSETSTGLDALSAEGIPDNPALLLRRYYDDGNTDLAAALLYRGICQLRFSKH